MLGSRCGRQLQHGNHIDGISGRGDGGGSGAAVAAAAIAGAAVGTVIVAAMEGRCAPVGGCSTTAVGPSSRDGGAAVAGLLGSAWPLLCVLIEVLST